MVHKLQKTTGRRDDEQVLAGRIELYEAYFLQKLIKKKRVTRLKEEVNGNQMYKLEFE